MCARHTITSGKYLFPARSLHTYLWSLTYSSTVKDIFRSISVEIWTEIMGKTQSSLLKVKTIKYWQNGMKRLQGFVLTVRMIVTCKYHPNPPAAISIYGCKYHAIHYCAYANGLPCLFCLIATPITLQITLLHPCVSFWGINYKKVLQQVLCKLWFIYCLSSSKSFEKHWFINYVYLI